MSVESIKGQLAQRGQLEEAPKTMAERIDEMGSAFEAALPSTITAERFKRSALTAIRQNPKLARCQFETLAGALLLSAQLGLEPGPLGHCWLIPRKARRNVDGNWVDVLEANFQLGYTGALELARRSGLIGTISAGPIYDWSELTEVHGTDSRLEVRPKRPRPEGAEPVAYWCHVEVLNGTDAHHVMERHEVDRIKERATQFDDGRKGPWFTDYDAMARITVFRAMRNWLPQSPQMARAFEAEHTALSLHTPRGGNDPTQLVEVSQLVPSSASVAQESVGQPPLDLPDDQIPDGEPFEIEPATDLIDTRPSPEGAASVADETAEGPDPELLARHDGSGPEVDYGTVTIAHLASYHKAHHLASLGIPAKADNGNESKAERINRVAAALDLTPAEFVALVAANQPPPPLPDPESPLEEA